MKNELIGGMGRILNQIPEELRRIWEELLVSLAQYWGTPEFGEKLKEPVREILRLSDTETIGHVLDLAKEQVMDFPREDLMKYLLQVAREMIIEKETAIAELREVLSELATPTIRVWKDVVLAPLIGSLDSERAQSMAEKVLNFISETRARFVIIDVTGVPIIDTIVGGFLIETFNAIKLLGCDVVLVGIKPEIAHTLAKLGIDFNMVIVKRDLESGLRYAIEMTRD
ncbi:MAG: STAS domain-containing protein [Candidatus Atribacteria bacterium]|nr:STAS domain-containing protein [Candidatus Atribacteria bacterium]